MEPVSILPPSVSELERDLELALARIEQIEIPIATLWNPWECPLEVLPFLAWALSVDLWRTDWPETVKRRVVANSLSVHRTKGTRPAVEKALSDLGVSTDLVEWFEKAPEGEPGTFEVTAWANENITPGEKAILNPEMYDQIRRAIVNSKNTRSHFEFKVGAKFGPNRIAMALALSGMAALARNTANTKQEPLASQAGIGTVSVTSGLSLSRSTQQPHLDANPRPSRCGVAGVCWGYSVIYRHMEASA